MALARKRAHHMGPVARRPMVLDAAAELFAEAGYGGTSMAAIGMRIGVSKGVLYDCFPGGKREILDELLARAEREFTREMAGTSDECALDSMVRNFFSFARSHRASLLVLFGRTGTRDRRIAGKIERARDRLVSSFETQLARAVPEGPPPSIHIALLSAVAAELPNVPSEARIELTRSVVQVIANTLKPGGDVAGEPGRPPKDG